MSRRKASSALTPILECFAQGQDDGLALYLGFVSTSHDAIIDELPKRPPTEKEYKYYVLGRQAVLADMLIAMRSMLNSKPRNNQLEDVAPRSCLFA
jgi:hypothetical protein